MKKQCRDEKHEGDNPLPESAFYETNPSYCRACVVRRVRETRERQENGEVLINGYLKRHTLARRKEAEIGESLMREKQGSNSNAGEMSLDRYSFKEITSEIIFGRRPKSFRSAWSA